MTVSTSTRRVDYAGDGVTLLFTVPFRFLARTDLRVIVATAAGVETVQTLDVDYSVAGVDVVTGGSITMTVAPAVGSRLVIKRQTTKFQPLDFTPFDPFPAEAQERALDRGILIDQEGSDEFARALVIPETDAQEGQMILPALAARAEKTLAFDINGRPVAGPSADQLNTLIATAFQPGISGSGAGVSFLQSGIGAVARTIQAKARECMSVLDFGAIGDGVANDTAAIQAAIAASCAAGAALFIPRGLYSVTALTTPNDAAGRFEIFGEPGSVIQARANGTDLLTIGHDQSRNGYRVLRGLTFKGNGFTNVRGIVFGNKTSAGALLQMHCLDLVAQNCFIGFELGNVQESIFTNLIAQYNSYGVVIQNSPTSGGATTLAWNGLRCQQNTVGFVALSNSIFPVGSWQFNQCLMQSNTLCGMAFFGAISGNGRIYAVNMDAHHNEGNGDGTVPGATATLRSRTILRSGVYIDGSLIATNAGEIGENITDVSSFVLRNGSVLTIRDGKLGGGQKTQVDADTSSGVALEGTTDLNGYVNGVLSWDGARYTGGGGGTLAGSPLIVPSTYPVNTYAGPGLVSDVPEAENALGATVSKVWDTDQGWVQQVAYAASIGNTGANRVTFNAFPMNIAIGDVVAVSVLVKASVAGSLGFILAGASAPSGAGPVQLRPGWQRVVLYAFAAVASVGGYLLYVFPNSAVGPTLQFAKMMCVRAPAGTSIEELNSVIRLGLFNNGRGPFVASGIPASGTFPRGTRIINSAPAVGAARAWIKVTTGSTNVLGTDWINEGNL